MVSGNPSRRPIAAVSGARRSEIQQLFLTFAQTLRDRGNRVVGMIERGKPSPSSSREQLSLVDLGDGKIIPISQDLGSASLACFVDGGGLSEASFILEHAQLGSADLVIVSKFGKLEAAGRGLRDVFALAISVSVPVLTAVNPALSSEWDSFTEGLAEYLPARRDALESWWRGCPRSCARAAVDETGPLSLCVAGKSDGG